MATKTNWHLAALDLGDDEPMQDIRTVGQPIDLSRGEAEIFEDIKRAMTVEAYLNRIGVACDIKQGDESPATPPCPTCPFYTEDPSTKLSRLCKLGREQAALLIEHQAAVISPQVDEWMARSLELAEAAHADELAEALL